MSLMRSSSVWLVLSTGCAYQASLAAVALAFIRGLLSGSKESGIKKTAGVSGGFWGVRSRCVWVRSDLSTAGGAGEPEVAKKIRASRMHEAQCSTAGACQPARAPVPQSRNFFHHWMARSTCGSSSEPGPTALRLGSRCHCSYMSISSMPSPSVRQATSSKSSAFSSSSALPGPAFEQPLADQDAEIVQGLQVGRVLVEPAPGQAQVDHQVAVAAQHGEQVHQHRRDGAAHAVAGAGRR